MLILSERLTPDVEFYLRFPKNFTIIVSENSCLRPHYKCLAKQNVYASGPSFSLDTACSSSLQGLHTAVDLMRSGQIDQAIIGGSHLTFGAPGALQFTKLSMTSSFGACRVFDASGGST